MIRIVNSVKNLLKFQPVYRFGGAHGPLDKSKIVMRN